MFTYFVYMFVNRKIVYTSPPTYRLIRRYLNSLIENLVTKLSKMTILFQKYQFSLKNGVFSQKWRFSTKNTHGKNLKKLSVIFIPLSNQSKIKITDFKLSRFLLIFSLFLHFFRSSNFLFSASSIFKSSLYFQSLRICLLRIFKFSLVFSVKRQLSIEIV